MENYSDLIAKMGNDFDFKANMLYMTVYYSMKVDNINLSNPSYHATKLLSSKTQPDQLTRIAIRYYRYNIRQLLNQLIGIRVVFWSNSTGRMAKR